MTQALELIQNAKRTRATRLDLGNCGLSELPDALFELTWLEELILSDMWDEYSLEKKDWEKFESQNQGEANHIKFIHSKIRILKGLKTLIACGSYFDKWDLSDLSSLKYLTVLQQLSVSLIQVSDLSPLKDLKALQQLSVNSTQVSDLSPLKDLTVLQQLSVNSTQVSDLSPLKDLKALQQLSVNSTQVRDLSPLKDLKALQKLSVNSTQVRDLSPLKDLKALQQLSVHSTQVSDLSPLKDLTALQRLVVSNSQVSDLSPLKDLSALQQLDVSNSQVSNINFLKDFKQLESIGYRNFDLQQISYENYLIFFNLLNLNKINSLIIQKDVAVKAQQYESAADLRDLQTKFSRMFEASISEKEINEEFNKKIPLILNSAFPNLKTPPKEIVEQGHEAILNYFNQIEDQGGTEELYEAKMIIVGEGGTGKTTLFEKLKNPTLPIGNTPETHGINIHEGLEIRHADLGEQLFHANLWDFGGQELQYMTHQFFLTPNALYVLMMDARRESPNLAYWFKIISLLGKDSLRPENKVKLLLVFNKRKGSTGKPPQYQAILDYYDTALDTQFIELDLAESGKDWAALKDKIECGLVNLPIVKSKLPKQWKPIREALRVESQTKPYITIERFAEICAEHRVKDEDAQLLLSRYLHQLGSLLHFQDDADLLDLVILKPEWAVEGVYTFLKDESIKNQYGKFTADDIFKILRSKNYLKADAQRILRLMSKNNFDICYRSVKGNYVAAQLLPDAPPSQYKWHTQTGALQFRYQYPIMPKGLMSRLIVRLSEHFEIINKTEIVWKKGAILSIKKDNQECRLMMKEDDEESPSGLRQIIIEVMGDVRYRKYALRKVRDEVDTLHERWFRSITVEEMVPCNCSECQVVKEPTLFKLSILLNLQKKTLNAAKQCDLSNEMIPIQLLLEGVYEKDELDTFDISRIQRAGRVNRGHQNRMGDDLPQNFHIEVNPQITIHNEKEVVEVKESVILPSVSEAKTEENNNDTSKTMNKTYITLVVLALLALIYMGNKMLSSPRSSEVEIGKDKASFKVGEEKAKEEVTTVSKKSNLCDVQGFIKINNQVPRDSDIKRIRLEADPNIVSTLKSGGSFLLEDVPIPKNGLIGIELVLKNDKTTSATVPFKEPNDKNLSLIKEILFDGEYDTKQQLKSVTVNVKFQQQISNQNGNGNTSSQSQGNH